MGEHLLSSQNDGVQGLHHALKAEGPVSSSFNSPNLSFLSWEEGIRPSFSQCCDEDKLSGHTEKQWVMIIAL